MASSYIDYSDVADTQLTALENSAEKHLYNEVIKVCRQIFEDPRNLRKFSSVITTSEGLLFATSVPGGFPYKVFWSVSSEGLVRIEAVFTYTK